jgi:hypothetical protein
MRGLEYFFFMYFHHALRWLFSFSNISISDLMSGLWSYRGVACSSSAADVGDVVRAALPLATLDIVSESTTYVPPQLQTAHEEDDYDSDDFEIEDDVQQVHTASPSFQSWLNGISERVDASSTLPKLFDVESALLELQQHGGELHRALHVNLSSNDTLKEMMLPQNDDVVLPGPQRSAHSHIDAVDSEQKAFLRLMIETSETALNLCGSSTRSSNSRLLPPQPTVAAARSVCAVPSPVTQQRRSCRTLPQHSTATIANQKKGMAASQESDQSSALRREQQVLKNEARAALTQCSLNRQLAEDELERQRSLAAISRIQRSHQNQKNLAAALPVRASPQTKSTTKSNSIGSSVTSQFSSSRSVSSRANCAAAATPHSAPHCGVSDEIYLVSTRSPASNERPAIASGTNSSVVSTAVSFRDPNVRLAASLQRRQQEISALLPPQQQPTDHVGSPSTPVSSSSHRRPIILDDRAARKQRVQEFTFRTTARAQQKEEEKLAVIRAAEQRVERHNLLRLMWFYAWLPWRKTMLLHSIVSKQASSFCERHLLKSAFCGWRGAAKESKKISFAASCARTLTLQRFLFWCWKRRVFLFWRSVVALRRAQERDAARFRKGKILLRWKARLSSLRQAQEILNDDAVSNFTNLRLRQTKRRLFRHWKASYDEECLERERATFRSFLSSVAKDVVL